MLYCPTRWCSMCWYMFAYCLLLLEPQWWKHSTGTQMESCAPECVAMGNVSCCMKNISLHKKSVCMLKQNIRGTPCVPYTSNRREICIDPNGNACQYIHIRHCIFPMAVSNIGFITVHGLNEGHVAPYTDIEFELKKYWTYIIMKSSDKSLQLKYDETITLLTKIKRVKQMVLKQYFTTWQNQGCIIIIFTALCCYICATAPPTPRHPSKKKKSYIHHVP